MSQATEIEKWDIFELALEAQSPGNPFIETEFVVTFTFKNRTLHVDGFYDGSDTYRARVMPDAEGTWQYTTYSNLDALDNISGEFTCTAASADNHGPVRVIDRLHFAYEDGTPYHPVGTTCYVWNHQGDTLEEQTLDTLKTAPFNKMRMCVFPKRYIFNMNEPEFYPFAGEVTQKWELSLLDNYRATAPPDYWDFDQFNPAFFQHLEQRIGQLRDLNIEADLIIFHPYDFGGWGFDRMPPEVNDRYLKYLVARLAAYRNIWWSFANEYDLMLDRSTADWDHYFKLVQSLDPYDHLRSIHNCREFYDHGKPWVTHCSVQHHDMTRMQQWLTDYGKPVVVDECGYEGDISRAWGSLTAEELVARHWQGFAAAGMLGTARPTSMRKNGCGGQRGGHSPATAPPGLRSCARSSKLPLLPDCSRCNATHPPETCSLTMFTMGRQPHTAAMIIFWRTSGCTSTASVTSTCPPTPPTLLMSLTPGT